MICPEPNARRADTDLASACRLVGRAARQDFRAGQLRAVRLYRPSGSKPAQDRAPFRTLHLRYRIETLGEAEAKGIETGHPTMPAFKLDPDQIHDLLSYLKSLEQGRGMPSKNVLPSSAK